MFKLIKIQNSGVNVPEPTILKKSTDNAIKLGEALILEDGLLIACPSTVIPSYVALCNAKHEDSEITVFEINSNMLFETTVNTTPASLLVGEKVTLACDDDGSTVMVTATTSAGVATIVDLMGASKSGDKITVKF